MGLQLTYIRYLNSRFRHYYLCRYLPLSAGKDIFSKSLLRFKRRLQPDLAAWIDCAIEVLTDVPLPRNTVILRALQHDETIAGERITTALDELGTTLAANFNCRYLPSLLLKSRTTLPCKQLSRTERMSELCDVYRIAPFPAETLPSFLLIDDILTTGATMLTLIQALRTQFPSCPIIIFTLARAEYGSAQTPPLQGSTYRLDDDAGWTVAEQAPPFYSAETLKSIILANTV